MLYLAHVKFITSANGFTVIVKPKQFNPKHKTTRRLITMIAFTIPLAPIPFPYTYIIYFIATYSTWFG